MKSIVELINALKQIAEAPKSSKADRIKFFQQEIWNEARINDESLNEVLSEIAYDLDYYEPDEEWRKESFNFYGDEKLNVLIEQGIKKLENLSRQKD